MEVLVVNVLLMVVSASLVEKLSRPQLHDLPACLFAKESPRDDFHRKALTGKLIRLPAKRPRRRRLG